MSSAAVLILAITLAALLAGAAGCSWGPGTHIQFTGEVLRRFRRRKSLNREQALVVRHYQPFLYGNIAADIINFKAYGGVKNHCHNWNIHERLLALARDEAAEAFILGYLCHLAADIVAHNHFVPYHLVYNFPPRILGHAYWEAVADSKVSDVDWHTVDGLKRNRAIHEYDRIVHRAVRWRALGLRSNKWIFNNILLINCRRNWRELIRSVQGSARIHPMDEDFHRLCRFASLRQMLGVFHVRRLALLKVSDPTGRVALQGSLRLRRELLRDYGERLKARDISRSLARAAYAKLPGA
jgi:hypothetical protein